MLDLVFLLSAFLPSYLFCCELVTNSSVPVAQELAEKLLSPTLVALKRGVRGGSFRGLPGSENNHGDQVRLDHPSPLPPPPCHGNTYYHGTAVFRLCCCAEMGVRFVAEPGLTVFHVLGAA